MRESNVYQIPSYQRQNAYNFDANANFLDIYKELNAIAEELELCRSKNS